MADAVGKRVPESATGEMEAVGAFGDPSLDDELVSGKVRRQGAADGVGDLAAEG